MTRRDPPLERELAARLETHVRAFADRVLGDDDRLALAETVERDLSAVAGVENVSTLFQDVDARTLRFDVTVRVGPREWLPAFGALFTRYPAQRGQG
jgi:hypothetical protein